MRLLLLTFFNISVNFLYPSFKLSHSPQSIIPMTCNNNNHINNNDDDDGAQLINKNNTPKILRCI